MSTPRKARLTCEGLEDRMTPTATVNGTVLTITGTAGNDVVRFVEVDDDTFQVVLNSQSQGNFSSDTLRKVVVQGLAGADAINASASPLPVVLQGGAGNDVLRGSAQSDLILGSTGNDNLAGNGGRDILIGGQGVDNLTSNGTGAILVGGVVDTNGSLDPLLRVRMLWNQRVPYETRLASIANIGFAQAVLDDGNANVLVGTNRRSDWFFQGVTDQLFNAFTNEVITPLF
jgi:Ca2+-binding RTX toxin-like protein